MCVAGKISIKVGKYCIHLGMVGFPDLYQFTRDQEGDHDQQKKNNTKKKETTMPQKS